MKAPSTKHQARNGYTLIELVVAVGLFALVMTLASGSYLLMIDLNRQAQGISIGIDNLSFVLETMTRSIRTGTLYNCGVFGGDCPSGADSFSFKNSNGTIVTYSRLLRDDGTGAIVKDNTIVLTDSSISVSSLAFYVSGTETVAAGDYAQPYVTIVVSGTVSSGPRKTPQAFTVQTGATMRGIDLIISSAPSETPPLPTCTLTADPTSILSGGSSSLIWTTTNANEFSINQGVGVVTPAAASEDPYTVGPLTTTTIYTGIATNSLGDSSTCTATVTVTSTPVNGSCAVTHYNCVAGQSADNMEEESSYTWSCIGENSGTTNSCSEPK